MTLQTSATFLLGFLELISFENELSAQLVDTIKSERKHRYFDTVIYLSHEENGDNNRIGAFNEALVSKLLANQLNLPMMHLRGNTTFYLWPRYNRRLFAIVPLIGDVKKDKSLLLSLWKTLRRNVKTNLLLLAKDDHKDDYLGEILKFCTENKAVNVVAVKESLVTTREFYIPLVFREFQVIKRAFLENSDTSIYPDQVKNMHKAPLSLAMQTNGIRAYILNKIENYTILGGDLGHFLTEFSRKHNATLTFPNYGSQLDKLYTFSFDHLIENGSYDISTALSYNFGVNDLVYSNNYDHMDWCLMVPVEKALPSYMFYFIIYDLLSVTLILLMFILFSLSIQLTFWIRNQPIVVRNLLFNVYVMNGLLGQSFKMDSCFVGVRSFLYMLICITGLILDTTYVNYLQTYNTRPPMEKPVKTLDDIKESGMKIAIYQEEYAIMTNHEITPTIKSLAKNISIYSEYTELRSSFNTRYVYPVPSVQWSIYEQQQKFFKKPLFRLSEMCLAQTAALSIPLEANSIYERAINRAIGQSSQSGLIQHWTSMSFLEAVRRKKINLVDNSSTDTFKPMKLEDIRIVFYMFFIMLLFIFVCFILELCWAHRRMCLKKVSCKLRWLQEA